MSTLVVAWLVMLLRSSQPPVPAVDFKHDVQPILEKRCTPCHFTGGKMYARLPFDRGATIVTLGEKRVFTRIKDSHEREVIRAFLFEKQKAESRKQKAEMNPRSCGTSVSRSPRRPRVSS